jgi:hypothetical protein
MRSPIRLKVTETRTICKSIKYGKSAGPGGIPGELLKYRSEELYQHLRELSQKCIYLTDIPGEWKVSYKTTKHKSGDKTKRKNYRGIRLLAV